MNKGHAASSFDYLLSPLQLLEEPHICRQAGAVRQQHSNCDLLPALIIVAANEFRHELCDRRLKRDQPALIQQHAHRRGRNHFRHRR